MPSKPASKSPRGKVRKASRTSSPSRPRASAGRSTAARRGSQTGTGPGLAAGKRGKAGAKGNAKPGAKSPAKTAGHFEPQQVTEGDIIRVERRFVLDGEMTCVADHGVYHGVQAMGSIEHILIESKGEVRLIPLQSVSEIVLEEPLGPRKAAPASPRPAERGFDPSFA